MENNVGGEVKEIVVEKKIDYSDIFVTENDTFEVSVKYYKENGRIYVETVDDKFSSEDFKTLTVTIKYPDQSDSMIILSSIPSSKNIEKMEIGDFLSLEFSRLMILIRKWNLDKKITKDTILNVNPKIIKGLLNKIRDHLGAEGLV